MNIYMVSQRDNNTWDTYSDFICAAENENQARLIDPASYNDRLLKEHVNSEGEIILYRDDYEDAYDLGDWTYLKSHIKVEFIGKSDKYDQATLILSSFHAG